MTIVFCCKGTDFSVTFQMFLYVFSISLSEFFYTPYLFLGIFYLNCFVISKYFRTFALEIK